MKHYILFFVLLMGIYFFPMNWDKEKTHQESISISIQGEVEEDVILHMEPYSTLEDALNEVKLTENADLTSLNRLTILKDGDVIVIPKQTTSSKISINTATKEELMSVKGIGAKKAQDIVDYREKNGLFQSLEDLMNVPGIKEKTFEKVKDQLSL